MNEIVIGVLAVVVGLFLCVRGQWALRLLLAVWGAVVGFGVGASAVDRYTEQGYLDSPAGWVTAVGVALLFAALAYLYFALGVVLAMAAMGFVIGGSAASALGLESPVLLLTIGVIGGLGLALLAIIGRLPQLVLIVVSAIAGASVAVGGLLLLLGETSMAALQSQAPTEGGPVWTTPIIVVLAVAGIIVQTRQLGPERRTVRENWR